MTYDLDIEPDDLEPEYISAKARLLELSRSSKASGANGANSDLELEIATLEAKIDKIEKDVLFDKYSAEIKWKSEKIIIEKQLIAAKKEAQARAQEEKEAAEAEPAPKPEAEAPPKPEEEAPPEPEAEAPPKPEADDVNEEAERIAAEILAQQDDDDDDDVLGGLFASLPQAEVDPDTGESRTVINSANSTKLILHNFRKWTGVSPRRILEEACWSRYVHVIPIATFLTALALTFFYQGTLRQSLNTDSYPRLHLPVVTRSRLSGRRHKNLRSL